jgi:hypothetical protein
VPEEKSFSRLLSRYELSQKRRAFWHTGDAWQIQKRQKSTVITNYETVTVSLAKQIKKEKRV